MPLSSTTSENCGCESSVHQSNPTRFPGTPAGPALKLPRQNVIAKAAGQSSARYSCTQFPPAGRESVR